MVGDNPHDDAGAALLGIRTLLLPRTSGPRHGLDVVLRLVDGA
jgi:FMN phosphatase YigB (HAD superfamily)